MARGERRGPPVFPCVPLTTVARVTREPIMILILSHDTIERTTEDVIDWLEYFGVLWYFPEHKIAIMSITYAHRSVSQHLEKSLK